MTGSEQFKTFSGTRISSSLYSTSSREKSLVLSKYLAGFCLSPVTNDKTRMSSFSDFVLSNWILNLQCIPFAFQPSFCLMFILFVYITEIEWFAKFTLYRFSYFYMGFSGRTVSCESKGKCSFPCYFRNSTKKTMSDFTQEGTSMAQFSFAKLFARGDVSWSKKHRRR